MLRPRRRIPVSQWAEEVRVLGPTSNKPGPWRNREAPYAKGIMDAFCDPRVERISVVAAVQVGKTEILNNMIGYAVDQEPGTILLVNPTEETSDKNVQRLHEALRSSPALRGHIPSHPDALGQKEIHLDRMSIYCGWANSPATLASTPCRYVFNDEVGKFPARSGRSASPLILAAVRTRTFRGRRKIVAFTSPEREGDLIDQELKRSNRQEYYIPCPHCGHYQTLDFYKGIKFPSGTTAEALSEAAVEAWYECEECKEKCWEHQKLAMLALGEWRAAPGREHITRHAGFIIAGLLSPWVSWSEIAADFLTTKDDPDAYYGFKTSTLGMHWKEEVKTVSDAKIRSRESDYKEGTVHPSARILTAAFDVQHDHFWHAVRAWGPGGRSWLVRQGLLLTEADLERVLAQGYPMADGSGFIKIQRAFVDSGDGHMTEAVYRFCRRNPTAWASKGSNMVRENVKVSRPVPGAPEIVLVTFRADFWKSRLSWLISRVGGDSGEWWTYKGVGDEYYRQMTSEQVVRVRKAGTWIYTWEPVSDKAPNHLWDCEVLNALAADSCGVNYLQEGDGPPPRPRALRQPQLSSGDDERPFLVSERNY